MKTSLGTKAWTQKGFNPFVDDSNILVPVNGAPSAGEYRSEIENREPIRDEENSLKSFIGSETIHISAIEEIKGEYGPNNEIIFRPQNKDPRVRYGGQWISVGGSTAGTFPALTTGSEGFIEIIWEGTDLYIITDGSDSGEVDVRKTTDGGSESGSSIYDTNASYLTSAQGYRSDILVEVESGLSYGRHTTKLRRNGGTGTWLAVGFVINSSFTQLRTVSGVAFSSSKREQIKTPILLDHDNGYVGSRGAWAVEYLLDGTTAIALTEVGSEATLLSTDHSNEEIDKIENFREFGANSQFSTLTTAADVNYVKEDNSTALVGDNVSYDASRETLGGGNGSSFLYSFVGCGIDVIALTSGASSLDTYEVFIDGDSKGNISSSVFTADETDTRITIASGLIYGSHSLKIVRNTAAANGIFFKDFITYRPKFPTLPDGAIPLKDYPILGDYDGSGMSATNGDENTPQGAIYKSALLNAELIGNWTTLQQNIGNMKSGSRVRTNTTGAKIRHRWYGTGIVLRMQRVANTMTFDVTIDGALNDTGVSLINMTNNTGGSYTISGGADEAGMLEFTGLAEGWHEIEVEKTGGSGDIVFDGFDIITPIYYSDPNARLSFETSRDLRKFSPISDETRKVFGNAKAWLSYNQNNNQILASHNIAAVVDVAVGTNIVFFERPFKDDESIGMIMHGSAGSGVIGAGPFGRRPGAVQIDGLNAGASGSVDSRYEAVWFGELAEEDDNE